MSTPARPPAGEKSSADDALAQAQAVPSASHVTVRGLRLEVLDIPASRPGRPPLVLLHEGLGCIALWRDFPQRLAAATGCRVLVWSRPGYGDSDPWPDARTPRYMHREGQEMLPAFLAATGVDRPILIGHSDGGSIALIHAAAHPQTPLGLVVMAPHEFVEPETLAGIRRARQAWQTTDWPQRLARYHRDAAQVFADWNDTWLSAAFRNWNIEDCLPAIRCPILAIQGADDEYATLRQIDVIAEKSADCQRLVLPDCGHSPHRDQATKVVEAIAGFVDRLAR
ncbi:alpha/beta fold hydrolase [Azonexus sp. R2A61]|uniref:alpha/beta fold hydrolase n=1 Tax=Azonexus sp. R2A61 TaxID=2744443 RepID=UPI001F445449|nr:alpha/beta hydrolase [Azonexus sp. R2A61]